MELKPGYKRTEVGIIPTEWDVRPLSSVADRVTVGIATAATHAYRNKGVPMFRNQNIRPGFLDDSDLLFIDPAYEKGFKSKRLRDGDLLTARTGYPGTTCVVPERYESAQSFTTLITSPNAAVIDSSFLCHHINSQAGQRFFEQGQAGGAQKNVNARTLRTMPLPVPALFEQRAIAAALSDVDALLHGLDQLIAKKRDLKQAAMQQLLTGQTRLRGFSREWEMKLLGELAEMRSGGTPLSTVPAYYGGGIPWVSIADMTSAGKIIGATEKTLTRLGLANSAAYMFPAGTVLYAMYASVGECSIAGIPVCTSQAILGIRPMGGLHNEFLYYFLTSIKGAIRSLAQEGTQSNLNKQIVHDFRIPLPSSEEQTAIAAVLSDMDTEIVALEARRDKTRDLKQAMMQELLTGKTRLVQPEPVYA